VLPFYRKLERELEDAIGQGSALVVERGDAVGVDEDPPALTGGDEAEHPRRSVVRPGDDDDVLDPGAPLAGEVDARLHRKRHAFGQRQIVLSEMQAVRINGQRAPGGIIVQTDPVHDCAGNIVPDGTIITFSASESNGKSTVDAPIKQGVARAKMEATGPTTVSAASGVVMGNELRIEAQR